MSKKRTTKEVTPSPYPIRSRATDRSSITVTDLAVDLMASEDSDTPLLDENESCGSVSYGLFKKLISQVEANLSNKLEKAVGEIKGDVSQIKIQLEKYNERFTEVQERISNVEDKVGKIDTVSTDLEDFKKDWKDSLSQINLDACKIRKNNVIVKGLKGGNKEPEVAAQNFLKLCRDNLKMPKEWIDNADVNEMYHFPPKGGEGNWPLFISFAKSKHREDIYKSAHNLKDSGIILTNDLAPFLLKERKDLIKIQEKLKKEPHNCEAKMRDTPYKVWMIVKRQKAKKWFTWKGWEHFQNSDENGT